MEVKFYKNKAGSPTLKQAQNFVGGLVEVVRLEDGNQMLVNEEGVMKNLPINFEASFEAGKVILGNAIILEGAAKWD